MRTRDQIRQRLEQWRGTKEQFFAHPYYVTVFDFFVARLTKILEGHALEPTIEENFWQQLKQIGHDAGASAEYMIANKKYMTRRWAQEFSWLMGGEGRGALSCVAWDFLLYELHDAECTFRVEGLDLVFEGYGNPPDFAHRGRTFRFKLVLKNAHMRDERSSTLPIEKVWILYHDPNKDEFLFTAQDDTLSGILTFSGDDFEFRLWDHKVP